MICVYKTQKANSLAPSWPSLRGSPDFRTACPSLPRPWLGLCRTPVRIWKPLPYSSTRGCVWVKSEGAECFSALSGIPSGRFDPPRRCCLSSYPQGKRVVPPFLF